MGHIHLATLPTSEPWRGVVALLGRGASNDEVIRASAIAAEKALRGAAHDPALVAAVYLLAMVPQAATSGRFVDHLADLNVVVPETPMLGDLAVGLSLAIEHAVNQTGSRSDLGEIARRALLGTLITMANDALPALFEADAEDVRVAIAGFARPEEFSRIARTFFGRLLADTLAYWLDRKLSAEVGLGHRFSGLADRDGFDRALGQHCVEATRIIREFAQDWYSLRLQQDASITPERSAAFTAVVFRKINEELRRKRGADA